VVEAEDLPERLLLETKICKEDGFQKQQGMRPRDCGGGYFFLADR
jgi:protein phosphatase-4 regulatory subunit 3